MMAAEVIRNGRSATGRLEALYRRHATTAVRLAYLLTGDQTTAEDLAQDAFVRVAGRLLSIRDPDAFEAYLRRTVVNLANSHFRRVKAERAALLRGRSLEVETVSPVETRDELWQALLVLPPRQRAALVLRYWLDLSETQTAGVLGCRPGTVKSLVSRGLDALREKVTT